VTKSDRPFPWTVLLICLASFPFWCIVLTRYGVPPGRAAFAGVTAALVLLLVIVSVWRRGTRMGPR
jgi:hypothetical protein